MDRRHKLVRRYHVSDAAEHDSQVLDDILDGDNTALGVWADSAYRSAEIEAALKEKGLRSRIHRKGRRNKSAERVARSKATRPVRRFGSASSMSSGPRATTWAGRWYVVSGWCGRRRGSG